MAHTPHTWTNGDVISATVLNALEQDLAAAATPAQIAAAIAGLTNGASTALDTLAEIDAQLAADEGSAAALAAVVAGKQNAAQVAAAIAVQATSDAATYVSFSATAPDHTIAPVWVDTSTTPQVVKGWNGTGWVAIGGGAGGAAIDDTATSTSKVWSSSKVSGALAGKASPADISTAITNLVNAAPTALDTLGEIATQLGSDETAAGALTSLVGQKTFGGTVNTITAAGALAGSRPNVADATSGPFTVTLPTPAVAGQLLSVEKIDSTANVVTISGTIRGTAGTIALVWQNESVLLEAESLTSWRPIAGHKTKASLDAAYDPAGAAAMVAAATDTKLVPINTTAGPRGISSRYVLLNPASNISFPSRIRPPEPRKRLVIRNDGTTDIQLAYGTGDTTNYNNPGAALFTITVSPRQEYIESSERPIFVRNPTDGGPIYLTVTVDLGVN